MCGEPLVVSGAVPVTNVQVAAPVGAVPPPHAAFAAPPTTAVPIVVEPTLKVTSAPSTATLPVPPTNAVIVTELPTPTGPLFAATTVGVTFVTANALVLLPVETCEEPSNVAVIV